MKLKAFFIIFEVLSLKKIKHNFLEGQSLTLITNRLSAQSFNIPI